MISLKNGWLFFCLLVLILGARAQTAEILAVADGRNYTAADLDPATRNAYEQLNKLVADERTEQLAQQIADLLFAEEAAARRTTIEKMLDAELKRRVSAPTDAQIKAVYEANAAEIGARTLAEVKPQIVAFLTREPHQKALRDFVGELKAKHKVSMGRDVNAQALAANDVLATINGKAITVESFDEKVGQTVYDLKADVYDRTSGYLENIIYSTLVAKEAKSLGLESQDLIAREISDKLREYSDDERERLQIDFQNRLFAKYQARVLLKAPAQFAQKISVDDDPSKGAATAPVTVVMFTDFQCPACAAAHPVLQKVLAEYAEKARFVVRDYPLVTIHQNAFQAAQAAQAAHAQGKFFEYTELLYSNQNALDAASLKKYAARIGLNVEQFAADLDGEKFAAEVRKDMADGEKYQINSTPTVFVNGVKVQTLSAQAFRRQIESALKK